MCSRGGIYWETGTDIYTLLYTLLTFISPYLVTSSIRGSFRGLGNFKYSDLLTHLLSWNWEDYFPMHVCLRSVLKVEIVNTRWRHLWKIKLEKNYCATFKIKRSLSQQWLSFCLLICSFLFLFVLNFKDKFLNVTRKKREMERYLNVFLLRTDKSL